MLDIESYVDEIEETEGQRVANSKAAGFPCLRAGQCPRPPLSTVLKPGDVVTGQGGSATSGTTP